MARESCSARMTVAARNAMVFGRVVSKEERIAELERVTTADLHAFFGRLTESAPTLVSVGARAEATLEAVADRFDSSLKGAA